MFCANYRQPRFLDVLNKHVHRRGSQLGRNGTDDQRDYNKASLPVNCCRRSIRQSHFAPGSQQLRVVDLFHKSLKSVVVFSCIADRARLSPLVVVWKRFRPLLASANSHRAKTGKAIREQPLLPCSSIEMLSAHRCQGIALTCHFPPARQVLFLFSSSTWGRADQQTSHDSNRVWGVLFCRCISRCQDALALRLSLGRVRPALRLRASSLERIA